MSEKILVPVLGESIVEATVSKWLKNEGDLVEADEPIVELETDKVNLEVPSPASGVLDQINSKDGSVVEVGALLGSISTNGSRVSKNEDKKHEELQENIEIFEKEEDLKKEELSEEKINDRIKDEPLVLTKQVEDNNESLTLSPAVRKIVSENKIDLKTVKGSGKDGRVLKGDLINLMGVNPPPSERKIKYGQEERIKMTRLRQTIAKRLKQAQENAALLTTFNEVDMTNVMEMKKKIKKIFKIDII